MAITPKLEIRQSQSLLMTPQLRQAINLLQMSNIELSELVNKELESNPLLEKEGDTSEAELPLSQSIDDYPDDRNSSQEDDFTPDIDYDNNFDDAGSDREGYDYSDTDYSWDDYNHRKKHNTDEDFDYFEKKLSEEKSLYCFLTEQIELTFSNKTDIAIASRLCEYLDDAGYFRGNIKEISQKLKVSEIRVSSVLEQLKGFEPSGIFAEDLAECLSMQLKDNNRFDPQIKILVENLPLLAERKFKELKKLCNADDEDLASMISDIKSLNPKPTVNFNNDLTSYIIPDVFVRRQKNGLYHVELNQLSLPRVLINRQYYTEIKQKDLSGSNKRYLKQQIGNASFLVKALHQRAETILRVSEEIVRTQQDFFEKGIEYLKPMALKDIAENVEMHESTISRVTANKYMHTPRGIFELKYFFSQAATTLSGDENTSSISIKHKLKKLIENEKADNILSDDKLVEIMAQNGIKIARRTIAKYREAMNIPSSAQRKREKRSVF